MKSKSIASAFAILVMLGLGAYWGIGIDPAAPIANANGKAAPSLGVVSGGSASAGNQPRSVDREAVATASDGEPDAGTVEEPGDDEHADVMRRFVVLRAQAVDLVSSVFPDTVLPEMRRPEPEAAKKFCDDYLVLVRPIKESEQAYYGALTDQITVENLEKYEKSYPVGESGLEFRDAVRAGEHPDVRLAPGEHLLSMSQSYMILPHGGVHLDYLRENVRGSRQNIAPQVHSLLLSLR